MLENKAGTAERRGRLLEPLVLSSHPVHRPLELGAGARRQAETSKTSLILKKERQAIGEISPTHNSARGTRRGLDGLVRSPQGDKHLTTVGAPAGNAFVGKPRVGCGDPPEVLVERLVLGGRRVVIKIR